MAVHVVTAENYWPLPWYLRGSKPNSVGYWNAPASWSRDAANLPPPDVIVTTPEEAAAIDVHVRAAYNRQMLYGLRPGVLLSRLRPRGSLAGISPDAGAAGCPPRPPLPRKATEGEPRNESRTRFPSDIRRTGRPEREHHPGPPSTAWRPVELDSVGIETDRSCTGGHRGHQSTTRPAAQTMRLPGERSRGVGSRYRGLMTMSLDHPQIIGFGATNDARRASCATAEGDCR